MIGALLLAVAAPTAAAPAPHTAIEAARAVVADAQATGQWTAFRAWSTPDALMFTPQPVKAHDFLKGRSDPPASVYWWPGRSYVSCDGKVAISTGPWVRGFGKSVGYFTTIWVRQADDGWKWTYDAGDELKIPRAEGGDIKPMAAACPTLPLAPPPQPEMPADVKFATGSSADGTLSWTWTVEADDKRRFVAQLWDGRERRTVIDDQVAAPPR